MQAKLEHSDDELSTEESDDVNSTSYMPDDHILVKIEKK